jgi:hypothetical protein
MVTDSSARGARGSGKIRVPLLARYFRYGKPVLARCGCRIVSRKFPGRMIRLVTVGGELPLPRG